MVYISSDIETRRNGLPFCISFVSSDGWKKFYRWKGSTLPTKVVSILKDRTTPKVFHNGAFDVGKIWRMNQVKTEGVLHDTLIMAKIGLPHMPRYNLKYLMQHEELPFKEKCLEYEEVQKLIKIQKKELGYVDFSKMPRDLMKTYNILDSVYTMKLFYYLLSVIDDPCYHLEQGVFWTVIDMEGYGIRIDVKGAKKKFRKYSEGLERMRNKMKRVYDLDNPNSTQQVNKLMYKELDYKPFKFKGRTHFTTDDLSLKLLKHNYPKDPFPGRMLKYRKYASYNKFLNQIVTNVKDGFIYPNFNQMGDIDRRRIKTGRFSSSNPNFQNLPRGKVIRELVIPRKNHFFLDLDYSQVEMRLFAFYANDELMVKIYFEGGDIHNEHKKIFVDPFRKDVDGLNRQIAKSIGFEILYGIGPPGMWKYLAKQGIIIPIEKVAQMIDKWHYVHPNLRILKQKLYTELKSKGFIRDVYGRKYYLPLVKSYIAVNYFIQGMSANIIKDVMPEVNDYSKSINGKMILQVHDELMIELPNEYLKNQKVIDKIKGIMEKPGDKLGMPLKVDYNIIKDNWGNK